MALCYMQRATLIYGYAQALVQLGYEALDEAYQQRKNS